MTLYTSNWFRAFREASGDSARCIVPLLLELTGSQSVVDFGCGLGVWLSEFGREGVRDIAGVDGSYVDQNELLIDSDRFTPHDLSRPLRLDRRFDLCLCLEVAEHVPESAADSLVTSLTSAAPIVYFSAAIPTQGGTGHVNEQWPEYWAEKFAARGYQAIDALRRQIWNNDRVDYWYSQNGLLYADASAIEANPRLAEELRRTDVNQLSMIHPRLFCRTSQQLQSTYDYRIRHMLRSARAFRKRLLSRAA